MIILGGLRHIRETGKVPENRAEIDEACHEVLKTSPSNKVVREWMEATKRRRRRPSSPKEATQG